MVKYITDNQTISDITIKNSVVGFYFAYGSPYHPKVRHDVKFHVDEVYTSFDSNLTEALIHYETTEYKVFQRKLIEFLSPTENDKEIEKTNRINKIKNITPISVLFLEKH